MPRQYVIDGMLQWPFVYAFRFSIPFNAAGNFIQYANPCPIQGDADFIWRALATDMNSVAPPGDWNGLAPASLFEFMLSLRTPDDQRLISLQGFSGPITRPLPTFGN